MQVHVNSMYVTYKNSLEAMEVQIRLQNYQYLAHEFPNPYGDGGNDGDDWSFRCRPLISLKVAGVEVVNSYPNLNYSKHNCKRNLSSDLKKQPRLISNLMVCYKWLHLLVQPFHL